NIENVNIEATEKQKNPEEIESKGNTKNVIIEADKDRDQALKDYQESSPPPIPPQHNKERNRESVNFNPRKIATQIRNRKSFKHLSMKLFKSQYGENNFDHDAIFADNESDRGEAKPSLRRSSTGISSQKTTESKLDETLLEELSLKAGFLDNFHQDSS